MISTKSLILLFLIYLTANIILFRVDYLGKFNFGSATAVSLSIMGMGVLFLLILMSFKSELLFDYFGLTWTNLGSVIKISSIIIGILTFFILLIFGIFSAVKEPPATKAFFTFFNYIIFGVTMLFALYFLKDYRFQNPVMRLLKDLLLYIPCLIYDLIDYVKHQLAITTPTAYIILAIDIALIVLNKLIGKFKIWYQHFRSPHGLLLEGPVYLNKKRVLGNFENMKAIKDNQNFSYRYGIGFDIYINPQPPNTSVAYNEYTPLFDYGGKPTLLYKADENKLKIQVIMNENETKDIYLGKDMKLQKWNKFLINYDGGTLDIFLNDKLISSTGSLAPYMTLDVVSVGADNGINGGIRNVVYFRDPVI